MCSTIKPLSGAFHKKLHELLFSNNSKDFVLSVYTTDTKTEDLNTVLSAAAQIETVQAEWKELNSNMKELTNIMKKQQPCQVR
jgi:hypothetical protein